MSYIRPHKSQQFRHPPLLYLPSLRVSASFNSWPLFPLVVAACLSWPMLQWVSRQFFLTYWVIWQLFWFVHVICPFWGFRASCQKLLIVRPLKWLTCAVHKHSTENDAHLRMWFIQRNVSWLWKGHELSTANAVHVYLKLYSYHYILP